MRTNGRATKSNGDVLQTTAAAMGPQRKRKGDAAKTQWKRNQRATKTNGDALRNASATEINCKGSDTNESAT